MNARQDVLNVLAGQPIGRQPVFSGLPALTAEGLRLALVDYARAHQAAETMARAAASTFELYGFESAVAPFDLCVEAEALGCQVDFGAQGYQAPAVRTPRPLATAAELQFPAPEQAGRTPLVAEALRRLRHGVGAQVAIGAWVPGPYTLAWQLFGAENWLMPPLAAGEQAALLGRLADFLAGQARFYRAAGADFITVHEMGGSPQVTGPRVFRRLVLPALQRLLAQTPAPNVLSVCGDTNAVMPDLAAAGAGAISVDHLNDLARSRAALGPQAVLLGNLDPVGVLSRGAPDDVRAAVRAIRAAGVSAVWPGCDLWPEIPPENFRALME